MQTNERVVVVKGDATKWYSQAVFIMNPSPPTDKIPVDFVAEAEKIIYNYMAKNYTPPTMVAAPFKRPALKVKRRVRFDFILYILMIAACIAMAFIFGFGMLS